MNVQEHLEDISESVLREYSFDILKNKINMKLEWIDGDYSKWYNLEIQDISCFYFINDSTERRKKFLRPEEGDFLELISIYILTRKINLDIIHHADEERWLTQFNGGGNISVEVGERVLILEAKYIQIDNERYELY